MSIPIIIPCYNNYKYVENIIKQLETINPVYKNFIIIMDNVSTNVATINWLNSYKGNIIWNLSNNGPWVDQTVNRHIFDIMPEEFIITDPDLQLNPNTPSNFIEQMLDIFRSINCSRLGLAIDKSDSNIFLQGNYYKQGFYGGPVHDLWNMFGNRFTIPKEQMIQNIVCIFTQQQKINTPGHTLQDILDFMEYVYGNNYITSLAESQEPYWAKAGTIEFNGSTHTLFETPTDTTFHIRSKNLDRSKYPQYRIAGNFTCKHLPWYKSIDIMSLYERYTDMKEQTLISGVANAFIFNLEQQMIVVKKNNENLIIENNVEDKNLDFWKNSFSTWEDDTFKVFDFYLSPSKIFIDIGGWIGTTCLYGSRKSKHVYVVEADKESFKYLERNIDLNSRNITAIQRAIYSTDGEMISFGPNETSEIGTLNESTSQIQSNPSNENSYEIQTITLSSILETYAIDPLNISLIKVDIEGGEENILNELLELNSKYKIPLYISFHYTWWKNKDLSRFPLLCTQKKQKILHTPFISLLF